LPDLLAGIGKKHYRCYPATGASFWSPLIIVICKQSYSASIGFNSTIIISQHTLQKAMEKSNLSLVYCLESGYYIGIQFSAGKSLYFDCPLPLKAYNLAAALFNLKDKFYYNIRAVSWRYFRKKQAPAFLQ
jgi:hypothetical protein